MHNLENQLLHKLENLMVSKVVLLIWYYQIEIIFCLIHLIFEKLAFCMAPCTILIISQSCTQVRKCVIYNFNLGWTLKVHIFWELRRGSFNDYVDQILSFFDNHLPIVDNHGHFRYHLPLSTWTISKYPPPLSFYLN